MRFKDPLISVIINCHDGEKYLHKSVGSILSQTYKNFEIIFWDNNSTDRSKKIIRAIKKKKDLKKRISQALASSNCLIINPPQLRQKPPNNKRI